MLESSLITPLVNTTQTMPSKTVGIFNLTSVHVKSTCTICDHFIIEHVPLNKYCKWLHCNSDVPVIQAYAIDNGSPQRTGTAQVIITVTDSNNKLPTYPQDLYRLFVLESKYFIWISTKCPFRKLSIFLGSLPNVHSEK